MLDDCPLKLRDSKKMTKRQRQLASDYLCLNVVYGLGWVWPAEIDAHGLTWAVGVAMGRALAEITADYDEIIIDGNINYFPNDSRARAVVKADDSVLAVSAASIVAKVARDKYMADLDERYACYGFGRHVGYGTAAHIAALRQFGICDLHRRSFKPVARYISI
jgi:ribonuclease HII